MEKKENCILYDWLTFSTPINNLSYLFKFLCDWLGHSLEDKSPFEKIQWIQETCSKLNYQYRISYHGMSIHYTLDTNKRYNAGACIELSGTGCRAYETYSGVKGGIQRLIDMLPELGEYNVTRLDVAYDDFSGVIDLEKMAAQAQDFSFTSRLQKREIINSSLQNDMQRAGITVTHGTRSSNTFIRCYDKAFERGIEDSSVHWVRCELQLRQENAMNFIRAAGTVGQKFSGVINQYLTYRDPCSDSNKRRWAVSQWWHDFVGDAAAIALSSVKDEDYNRDRLHEFVYEHMANALITVLLLDGKKDFLKQLVSGYTAELPAKYVKLLSEAEVTIPQNGMELAALLGLSVRAASDSALVSQRLYCCCKCGLTKPEGQFGVVHGAESICKDCLRH